MDMPRALLPLLAVTTLFLAGCATRPVNPPLVRVDTSQPYRIERHGAV